MWHTPVFFLKEFSAMYTLVDPFLNLTNFLISLATKWQISNSEEDKSNHFLQNDLYGYQV